MSGTPCLFYEVEKTHIVEFANLVRKICPDAYTIYRKKYHLLPGVKAQMERESYDYAETVYKRIAEL